MPNWLIIVFILGISWVVFRITLRAHAQGKHNQLRARLTNAVVAWVPDDIDFDNSHLESGYVYQVKDGEYLLDPKGKRIKATHTEVNEKGQVQTRNVRKPHYRLKDNKSVSDKRMPLFDIDGRAIRPWETTYSSDGHIDWDEEARLRNSVEDTITDANWFDLIKAAAIPNVVPASPEWVKFLGLMHTNFKNMILRMDKKLLGEDALVWAVGDQGKEIPMMALKTTSGELVYAEYQFGKANWFTLTIEDAIDRLESMSKKP